LGGVPYIYIIIRMYIYIYDYTCVYIYNGENSLMILLHII
jgi:hypothetical protein